MNKLVLIVCMAFLSMASNAEVIFKCHQPFSIFNPNFQQGSELYLDISLNNDKKEVGLDFGHSFGPSISPVDERKTQRFGFSEDTSSFYAAWEKAYLSMVYTGNLTWGAFVKLGEQNFGLPREVEMQCREVVDILDFATHLN